MKTIKNKNIKWWLSVISLSVFFVFIGVFAYYKMCFISNGVNIKAEINQLEGKEIAEIRGNALKATHLLLNGREIYIGKDGNFYDIVALLPGLSILTLRAEDKFGNITEKRFDIVYEKSLGTVAFIKS